MVDLKEWQGKMESEVDNLKVRVAAQGHTLDKVEEAVHTTGNTAKALHKRTDHQDEQLAEIKNAMLTRESFSEELDTQLNKHIVRILKTIVAGGFVTATGAFTAWLIHLFGIDK